MNIVHILGITILLMGAHSAIEEPKSKTQRTLLRRLQSYQPKDETKPLTWNEVLADVLVNKIRIFSSKRDTEDKEESLGSEMSALTRFVSQVFVIYKKFIYDVFITTPQPENNNSADVTNLNPEIEERDAISKETVSENSGVTFSNGPKGEVELIEPRYHGKQTAGNDTDEENSVVECPEGSVRVEGKCVNNSRMIFAIPGQCPYGYRRDRLGFCRLIF